MTDRTAEAWKLLVFNSTTDNRNLTVSLQQVTYGKRRTTGSSVARVQQSIKEIALPTMAYIEDRGFPYSPRLPASISFLATGTAIKDRALPLYLGVLSSDTLTLWLPHSGASSCPVTVCFFLFCFSSHNNNSSNVLTYCLKPLNLNSKSAWIVTFLSCHKAPLNKEQPISTIHKYNL